MSAAFDREEKPDNHKKPQKHYKMASNVEVKISSVSQSALPHNKTQVTIVFVYDGDDIDWDNELVVDELTKVELPSHRPPA